MVVSLFLVVTAVGTALSRLLNKASPSRGPPASHGPLAGLPMSGGVTSWPCPLDFKRT
jgi:hypothetical protein